MGIWRGLRAAFIAGSLLMILLIILYWDDVGGFSLLYPRGGDLKHDPPVRDPVADLYPRTQTPPGLLLPHPPIPTSLLLLSDRPTIRTGAAHTSSGRGGGKEERGEEVEEHMGEERKDIEGERGGGEEEEGEEERRRQEVRKHTVMDICSGKDSVEFPGKSRTFDQIPNRELDHLIVDDTHQVIYCYVPKVACTNWKRVMVVLSQSLVSPSSGKPYTDPESVPPDLVHNASLHLTFAKFWRRYGSLSRHLMAVKLQRYTKFLFVRDPFVRLISAFRNKFGRPNEDFYRQFGSVMLRRHGNLSQGLPETAAEAFAAGIRPTFQQFIKYLLDPETEREATFNEHWRQVYRLCHPCQVQYDFIGRLETLETDSEQLLRILGVDHMLHFPTGARNRTAASWENDWFAQIPMATRRELYRLYEPDFELFGYPKPDAVLHL